MTVHGGSGVGSYDYDAVQSPVDYVAYKLAYMWLKLTQERESVAVPRTPCSAEGASTSFSYRTCHLNNSQLVVG